MDNQEHGNTVWRVLTVLLWAGAGLLFIRFLLPVLLPFLLAFLTAALCEPVIRVLTGRLHLTRGFASAVCVLIILLSLIGFFLLVILRLLDEALGFLRELPELMRGLPQVIDRLELTTRRFVESCPASMRTYVDAAIDSLAVKAQSIPAALSAMALDKLTTLAGGAPKAVLFCATYAIGSLFISARFPEIRAFLRRQIPGRLRETAHDLKTDLLDSLGRWLRAELTLMLITFGELTAAFWLLRVDYAVIVALLTAVIDALPVFGTGVVLLPWAAAQLISGDSRRAMSLLVVYLLATLVRNLLEPKLMGDQFGVNPAAALLAMYAGFRLCGVAGMVLFPFSLMMLNQMNAKGYVKLWK